VDAPGYTRMTGTELVAQGKLTPGSSVTIEEIRIELARYLREHPEITKGLVLELWWDGRWSSRIGGPESTPGYVTTLEHPDPDAWRRV
jgi:hypothetical protein